MSGQEISDYHLWNTAKIKTAQSKPKNIQNGHIYWTKIGKNIGCEVFGKNLDFVRPVLVVKRFSIKSSLFLGIPLTSKIKNNSHSYIFTDSKNRQQNALLNQMRVFNTRRIVSRCGKINYDDLKKIAVRLSDYILAK